MPEHDLLARLREAADTPFMEIDPGDPETYGFTPEQVQRGLERMRTVPQCGVHGWRLARPTCEICWAAMLDAFIQGVRDA